MKGIRYICTKGPFRLITESGNSWIDIETGTIITKTNYNTFQIPNVSHTIRIESKDLNKYFKRYYTNEEIEYRRTLREKAAIAAMQRLIYKKDNMSGYIIEKNPRCVAEKAVEYADALTSELIRKYEEDE